MLGLAGSAAVGDSEEGGSAVPGARAKEQAAETTIF
jgi:hypothetical protein